jgi:hypothetical protein
LNRKDFSEFAVGLQHVPSEPPKALLLNLPDPLPGHAKTVSEHFERLRFAVIKAEAAAENRPLI